MDWTKKKPAQTGWYWRKGLDSNQEIVRIGLVNGELKIISSKGIIRYPIPEHSLWVGPIPKPE